MCLVETGTQRFAIDLTSDSCNPCGLPPLKETSVPPELIANPLEPATNNNAINPSGEVSVLIVPAALRRRVILIVLLTIT
jgi:hypothetical protein